MLGDSMNGPANGLGMAPEFGPDYGSGLYNAGAIRFLHGMSVDDSWANVAFVSVLRTPSSKDERNMRICSHRK